MIRLAIRSYILSLSLEEQQDLINALNQPENVLIRTVLLQFNEDGDLYLNKEEFLKIIELINTLVIGQELKSKIVSVLELILNGSNQNEQL